MAKRGPPKGQGGRPKGLPKSGGRKPGSPNKTTIAVKQAIELAKEGGKLPLTYFLEIMRDPKKPVERRDWAAAQAAPYIHPRLQAIAYEDRTPVENRSAPIDMLQFARMIALVLRFGGQESERDVTPPQISASR